MTKHPHFYIKKSIYLIMEAGCSHIRPLVRSNTETGQQSRAGCRHSSSARRCWTGLRLGLFEIQSGSSTLNSGGYFFKDFVSSWNGKLTFSPNCCQKVGSISEIYICILWLAAQIIILKTLSVSHTLSLYFIDSCVISSPEITVSRSLQPTVGRLPPKQ